MDMEKALDEAVRAKHELHDLLADLIATGVVQQITAGATGKVQDVYAPTVSIHLATDRVSFRKMRSTLMAKVQPVKDNGVSVSFVIED